MPGREILGKKCRENGDLGLKFHFEGVKTSKKLEKTTKLTGPTRRIRPWTMCEIILRGERNNPDNVQINLTR